MTCLQDIPCPVLFTDLEGNMLDASQEMVELVLEDGNAWRGQPMERLLPPAGRAFLQTHLWPTLLNGGRVREAHLKLLSQQGQQLPVLVNARLVQDGGPAHCIWVFFVAHDRSRFEAELIHTRTQAQNLARELDLLSQTDPLTGLGNRRMLKNAFVRWLSAQPAGANHPQAQAALLMVDADHFKRINDRWGHDEGDRVLVELAQALRRVTRRSDLVVRHGGEEFIVWLPDGDPPSALRVAEHIHEAARCIALGGGPSVLTVSIGLAHTAGWAGPVDLDTLVSVADQALYRAKTQGRDQTVSLALHHALAQATSTAPAAANPHPP